MASELCYAANLDMLWTEVPMLERPARAAAAGFGAVEVLFPYEHGVEALRARLCDAGLRMALFDMPSGGQLGWLGDPARRAEWQGALDMCLDVAGRLECGLLNALAGPRRPDLPLAAQRDCAVENLLWAAPRAAACGVTLLVEFLNPLDRPAYLVHGSRAALDLVRAVDRPNVLMQYDVYHAQRAEGNLLETIEAALPSIGHVQVADVPGRHEPGAGEINYPAVLRHLAVLGYRGYVGLEYIPSADTDASLAWLPLPDRGRNKNA